MINADLFDRCAKVERPRSTAGAAGGFARAVYDLLEKALPVRASGARPEVRNEFATYGYEVTTTVYSFRGDWRQNDRITLDESVTMAFLVVLDSMTPAERVAFVLHDVFRYSFADIAEIVGRSPAACRQLASSARRRIQASRGTVAPRGRRADVVRAFKQAWAAKDVGSIVRLLDPAAVVVADSGGKVEAAREPIEGAERIARTLVEVAAPSADLTILERTVNGEPGLVVQLRGVTVTVLALDVRGDVITRIWSMRNPDKLQPWVAPAPA